jgi:anthranilate phosphoribosyltransferase
MTNSRRLRTIFDGESAPAVSAIVLNSAHALVIAGVSDNARDGAALAAAALRSGAARAKLGDIVRITHSFSKG